MPQMRKVTPWLVGGLWRRLVEEGVRKVEQRGTNPRLVGFPMGGGLYVTAARRGEALGMAWERTWEMSRDARRGGGWVGIVHERDNVGWVVGMTLADFAALVAYIEGLERGE